MKTLILVLSACFLSLIVNAEKEITREEWDKYFRVMKDEEVRYTGTARHPIMNFDLVKIVRYKEDKDGWSRFVGLDEGGPTDGDTETVWLKTTKDGRFKKDGSGAAALLVPFPLSIGQEWKRGDQTIKLLRKEDLEVSTGTLKDCLVFEVTKSTKDGIDKGNEWWAIDHGEVLVKSEMAMGLSVRKKKVLGQK
jgi:hypothetical protein